MRALNGVSFDLRAGEVHAILGENGAGKSTLIKVITGAHQPDGGAIKIDGVPAERLNPASARGFGIAAVYQQPALFPDLSVAENIGLTLEEPSVFRRVRWGERESTANELLRRIGAEIRPDTEVRDLSMPEQQLVEIARTLRAGARILIMDEPTASLTSKEVDLLLALVKELRTQGVGIIYITHRLEEVFRLANRVTVLRDGESVGTRPISAKGPEAGKVPATAAQASSKAFAAYTAELMEDGHQLGLTESELIQMMVGREVSTIFPPPENQPGEVVLKLRGVGCRASGVHDVRLDLRKGEILGLAGLIGAGRTELARVLFGITPADAGTITLEDEMIHLRNSNEAVDVGIAYLPEDRRRHGVILEMQVASNVTMAIHRRLFPGTWLRPEAENMLTQRFIRELGIKTPSTETRAGELSGGNQQKVALARWLATSPKVMILDEPTQGVDVRAKAEIHRLIRQLAAKGMAVLMISSELPEILGMSDRIAVMRGGTIVDVLPGQIDAHRVMAAALGKSPNNE